MKLVQSWVRIGLNLEKLFNKKSTVVFLEIKEVYDTNRKLTVITVLTMVAFATVIGSVFLTHATETSSPDTTPTTSTTDNTAATATPFDGNCTFLPDAGFGGMQFGGHMFGGQRGEFEGFGMEQGNVEISQEFNTTVTNIVKADSDAQNLLSSGYNITSIMPIYTRTLDGNGTLTTQATTAIVLLQNGTTGHSIVNVDIANSKVTRIETITRTVIDKS